MLINDLEFMIPCDQKSTKLDFEVSGGSAFASVSVATGRIGNGVFASSSAYAGGDHGGTDTATGVAFIDQGFFTAGYTVAYGAAVGADTSGSFVSDYDYSFSLF